MCESHVKHVVNARHTVGVFTMKQTHVRHVFGVLCILAGKLVSDK
jgi:hypothetical protein